MKLPIRLSSAQEMLNDKLGKIQSIYGQEGKAKQELITTLEEQKKAAEQISIKMLQSLGYSGTLQEMENELNENIKGLQNKTSFLNGEELSDFMIGSLSKAIPYDPEFQARYMDYMSQKIKPILGEGLTINKEGIKEISKQLGAALGFDDKFTLTLGYDKGGTAYLQGFNPKTGGSTVRFKLTPNFIEQTPNMRKHLVENFGKIAEKTNGENYILEKTFNTTDEALVYSLLRLPTHPDKKKLGLESLKGYETIVKKVKDFLKEKIKNQNSDKTFIECVDEVIDRAANVDLFAGENAPKKLTGLLGEIQGLYYIRSIIKNKKIDKASVDWMATEAVSGKQPHADLLLKTALGDFGIQVKNTTISAARQEISFQSFKSKMLKLTDAGATFEMPNVFSNYVDLSKDSEMFEAISTLIMMENFNIPYVWENGKAYKATMAEVPTFEPTGIAIIEAAKMAEKAFNMYAASLMYMQLSNEVNLDAGGSNSLYLVGGSLAITSASILIDIINNLEKSIQSFKLSVSVHQREDDKSKFKGDQTIVDFLNSSGSHVGNMYVTLSSSYTF